jgi:hypothetical protein
MRTMLSSIVAAVVVISPALGQKVITFGGQETCDLWLTNPEAYKEGYSWILGFWTGLNVQASLRDDVATVGQTLDAKGVIGEVAALCARKKSMRVDVATTAAWARVKSQQR